MRWCSGVVVKVCDRTLINPGKRRQCYKEREAVEVFWGAIPEYNMEASRSIEPFNSRLWNKNYNQAWRMDLFDIRYGLGT